MQGWACGSLIWFFGVKCSKMGVTHPSFVILSGLIKRAWRFRLQTDRSGICDLIFEKDVGPLSKQIVWLDLWVCVFNEFINLYGSHASLLYYLCFLFILLFIALCCSCLGLMVFLLVCIPHVALIHQYMDMYYYSFLFFSSSSMRLMCSSVRTV